MPPPNIGTLRAVADRLDSLGLDYAFVGGSIVSFLVDDPELSPARATDDVDVILEVVTSERYSSVEARLRSLGFDLQTIASFNEALSGYLPSDQASQQRLPLLRKKLRDIAALSIL